MTYTDILYEKKDGVAWITINRPEVRNAFRTRTVAELTDAFVDARWDPAVGVVVLTGAGDKAFCSGGDQKERGQGGYAPARPAADGRRSAAQRDPAHPQARHRHGQRLRHRRRARAARALRPVDRLGHRGLRPDGAARGQRGRRPRHRLPRARRGREEGAGDLVHVPAVLGPATRSRWGSSTRWCRPKDLRAEVEKWCAELLEKSPTALALAKQSFNIDSEQRAGVAQFANTALGLYYQTRGGHGGPQRLRREAPGRLLEVPEVMRDRRSPRERITRVHRPTGSGATRAWRPISTAGRAGDPDKTAMVDGRSRYTYAELARAVERVAHGLRAHGVEPGSVISCQLPNWNEFVVLFLAAAPPRRRREPDSADLPGERAALHAGPARVAGRRDSRDLPRLPLHGHAGRPPGRAADGRARLRRPRGAGRGHASRGPRSPTRRGRRARAAARCPAATPIASTRWSSRPGPRASPRA